MQQKRAHFGFEFSESIHMNCTNCGHSLVIDTSLRSLGNQDRGKLSTRLKVAQDLLVVLSQQHAISLIMCENCAMDMTDSLEAKLEELRNELKQYKVKVDRAQPTIPNLQERFESALRNVVGLETESLELSNEWEQLLKEGNARVLSHIEKELEQETEQFWMKMNLLEADIHEHQEEFGSIKLKYQQAEETLDTLSKTNVYADAFKIWHEGPFGTINGCRLSKVQDYVLGAFRQPWWNGSKLMLR